MNYRLSEETILHEGVTLHRIVCTKTFKYAKVGDIGGFIEKETNLSGNAWVYGNAQVFGDARVFGNARVIGDAQVYGEAQVFGEALVFGDARVFGNARVFGDARVYGNAQVYGEALVFGDARVYGDARVFGNARVYGDALVYGVARVYFCLFSIKGSKHTVSECGDLEIKIGCQKNDINTWLLLFGDIGKKYKYTESQIQEYKAYLDCIASLREIRNNNK